MSTELNEAAEKYAEAIIDHGTNYRTNWEDTAIKREFKKLKDQFIIGYPFVEQFKAEQKPSAGVKFPLPSEWIGEFKEAWMKDNDIGVIPKNRIKELWDSTERVCHMIYKYQRKAFESQFIQPKQLSDEEIEKLAEKVVSIGTPFSVRGGKDYAMFIAKKAIKSTLQTNVGFSEQQKQIK